MINFRIPVFVCETKEAGYYLIEFEGTNLASGVYFYRLVVDSYGETRSFTDVKKMVLVK